MTRWSAITRTRRSCSALAYGSRSTAAAERPQPARTPRAGTLLEQPIKHRPAHTRELLPAALPPNHKLIRRRRLLYPSPARPGPPSHRPESPAQGRLPSSKTSGFCPSRFAQGGNSAGCANPARVARRKKPMPQFATRLTAVSEALEAVSSAEAELERARRRLRTALRAAHRAGASYSLLGRLAGLSRQRVAQLIDRR